MLKPEEPDGDILLGHLDVYHAAAIGRVVANWSRLEYEMDLVIWELARLIDDDTGPCITSQLIGPDRRLDAIISLAKYRRSPASAVKNLEKFKKAAKPLGERRNRIVHDSWYYGMDTKKHYRLEVTARSKLHYSYKHITEEELTDLDKLITKLRGQFAEIPEPIVRKFHNCP